MSIRSTGPRPACGRFWPASRRTSTPTLGARVCARALADLLGIGLEKILAGNGSGELIWLTALAFLRVGDRALIVGPTYDEYARAVRLMGAVPHHCLGRAEAGYHVAPGDVARALADVRPAWSSSATRITLLASRTRSARSGPGPRQADALFVVDESYWEFGPRRGPPSTWARTTFWYCDR